jgi:hypothetical protein
LDLNSGTKDPLTADEHLDCSPEAIQARGRLAWAAAREKDQQSGASPEDIQRLARVRWQQYRKEGRGPRGRLATIKPAPKGEIAGRRRTMIKALTSDFGLQNRRNRDQEFNRTSR